MPGRLVNLGKAVKNIYKLGKGMIRGCHCIGRSLQTTY